MSELVISVKFMLSDTIQMLKLIAIVGLPLGVLTFLVAWAIRSRRAAPRKSPQRRK